MHDDCVGVRTESVLENAGEYDVWSANVLGV